MQPTAWAVGRIFAAKRRRTAEEGALIVGQPSVGNVVEKLAGQYRLAEDALVTSHVQFVPVEAGPSVQ